MAETENRAMMAIMINERLKFLAVLNSWFMVMGLIVFYEWVKVSIILFG